MISLTTLNTKYKSTDGNDNTVVDLTRGSIESLGDIHILDIYTVTNREVMRPDLIAQSYYSSSNYLDYILKFNGISNPFSIYEGQVLFIPDLGDMKNTFKSPTKIEEPQQETSTSLIDVVAKNTTDKKRLEALQEKADNTKVLPANMNDECENNVTITNEKIVLGSCISNTDPFCSGGTTTRARLKQKLAEQKINR